MKLKIIFTISILVVMCSVLGFSNAYAQTQSTTLVLDPFSSPANIGETITFSGKLTSDGNGVSGAIVNIMDEDLLDTSDKLISTTTDSNGHFSVNWTVRNTEAGDRQLFSLAADFFGGFGFATQANSVYNLMEADTVEIYAKFSGNDQYSKSNTCLSKIVNDKSKINCENNILKIQGEDSFKNFIMSAVMTEIGADVIGTDSFDSILSGQNDSIDMMSLEDLLLEQLQIEIGDLENIDLTMEQMLEILDDPSLSKMYGAVTPIPVTPIPVTPVIPNYFSTHHDSNDLFSIDIPNNWDLESYEGGVIFYDDSDSWNAFVLITYIENSHMGSKPFPMILDELEKQERDYCTYSTFEQSGEICYNYNKLSAEVIDGAVLVVQSHTNQYDSLNPHEYEMISFTYWIIDGNNHWELYGVVDQSYKDPYFDIIGESLQSFTINEQSSNEFQNNFGATIELDWTDYVPTDRVYITIVAPDLNMDSNQIDTIGNDNYSELTISTSKGSLSNYKLIETGKSTGIFVGEITLVGDKFTTGKGSTNGKLSANYYDELKVQLNLSDFTVTSTANIDSTTAEVYWLEEIYKTNDVAKIRLIDPDMNLNPDIKDTIFVKVYSDSDYDGKSVKLTEIGEAHGIFEGNVEFSTTQSNGKLLVSLGDSILVEFEDTLLPYPYDQSDSLVISSTSNIFGTKAPLQVVPQNTIPEKLPSIESELLGNTNQLQITSDEDFYKIGDTVTITGKALSDISNINFKVIDPNGDMIKMLQAKIGKNNMFQTSFEIGKQFFPLAGGYEIIAWQSRESKDTDSIPITIGIKGVDVIKKAGVPNWIKNNAEWWAEGAIDDSAFTQGIQYLIKEKIMNVESTSQSSAEPKKIPSWVKNNAEWWADGSIDEGSFVAGIEFLVKEGIIQVN